MGKRRVFYSQRVFPFNVPPHLKPRLRAWLRAERMVGPITRLLWVGLASLVLLFFSHQLVFLGAAAIFIIPWIVINYWCTRQIAAGPAIFQPIIDQNREFLRAAGAIPLPDPFADAKSELKMLERQSSRHYPDNWGWVRQACLARDNRRCVICSSAVDLDGSVTHHIVPFSQVKTTAVDNLVTLCHDCHCEIHPWLRRRDHPYWVWARLRTNVHCHKCRRLISTAVPVCDECGWLYCHCGGCGCNWPGAAST